MFTDRVGQVQPREDKFQTQSWWCWYQTHWSVHALQSSSNPSHGQFQIGWRRAILQTCQGELHYITFYVPSPQRSELSLFLQVPYIHDQWENGASYTCELFISTNGFLGRPHHQGLPFWPWISAWPQDYLHLCGQGKAKAQDHLVQGRSRALLPQFPSRESVWSILFHPLCSNNLSELAIKVCNDQKNLATHRTFPSRI